MTPKIAPPPPITPETMRALLSAATAFAAGKPWESIYDSDVVGLIDSRTGAIRLGTVLGHAGEVFGAAFYPYPAGVRWLLQMLETSPEDFGLDSADGMDALKAEFVTRRELPKEDFARLKALDFKPVGKGCVWPQFQSAKPGWLPWFINQTEAEQLVADLPRLTAFCGLMRDHPDLLADHPMEEIPFLPHPMPDHPLRVEDLDWRPLLTPPETITPFAATVEQMAQLHSLQRVSKSSYEYGCSLLPGSTVLEQGRPCFSRISLLVEQSRGLVLGSDFTLGKEPLAESAGRGLVEILLKYGFLPGKILIPGPRLQPMLQSLCDELKIELEPMDYLPALEEAKASLEEMMAAGMGQGRG